jgi:hypothetical protein
VMKWHNAGGRITGSLQTENFYHQLNICVYDDLLVTVRQFKQAS